MRDDDRLARPTLLALEGETSLTRQELSVTASSALPTPAYHGAVKRIVARRSAGELRSAPVEHAHALHHEIESLRTARTRS